MQKSKIIISLLLCMVMFAGLMATPALAADDMQAKADAIVADYEAKVAEAEALRQEYEEQKAVVAYGNKLDKEIRQAMIDEVVTENEAKAAEIVAGYEAKKADAKALRESYEADKAETVALTEGVYKLGAELAVALLSSLREAQAAEIVAAYNEKKADYLTLRESYEADKENVAVAEELYKLVGNLAVALLRSQREAEAAQVVAKYNEKKADVEALREEYEADKENVALAEALYNLSGNLAVALLTAQRQAQAAIIEANYLATVDGFLSSFR